MGRATRFVLATAATLFAVTCCRLARADGGDERPAPPEPFVRHEPYATSGFAYYGSDRRVIAGLGGGLGYRLNLGRHIAAYAEGRWVTYIGSAFTGAAGVAFRYRLHGWEPLVGLQGAAFRNDRIVVLSSAYPGAPPDFAWAVQARVALLRFVDWEERFTASALALDWGYGVDGGTKATAISVSLVDIGFRL